MILATFGHDCLSHGQQYRRENDIGRHGSMNNGTKRQHILDGAPNGSPLIRMAYDGLCLIYWLS